MNKWQPIETAPKDGTWVLVTPGSEERVSVGMYSGERGACLGASGVRYLSGWVDKQGSVSMSHGECEFSYESIWPTHWMPLPEPPK